MIEPKYITYPKNAPILNKEEIEYILVSFLNNNPSSLLIVKGIIDEINDYLEVKKGNEYAVVLKGEELAEEILCEISELCSGYDSE